MDERCFDKQIAYCEDNELVRYRDDEHEIGLDGANVVKTPRLILIVVDETNWTMKKHNTLNTTMTISPNKQLDNVINLEM